MATNPNIVVTASDRASAALNNVARSVDGISAPVLRLAGAFGTLAGSVGVGLIVNSIRNIVGVLDDLDEASQAIGVSAVALAEFRLAASQSGVATEKLDISLTKLNVKMADAAGGGKESAAAFKALGINVQNSAGNLKSTEEVLGEIANKFQGFRDGAEKSALAVALFGKAGAAMIPFLNQGAEGLRKFAGVTEESVLAARKLQGEFDKLSANMESFKQKLAGSVIPALNDFLEVVRGIDFSRAFSKISPTGVFSNLIGQSTIATRKLLAQKDALENYAAEYSNEGRAYLAIAPIIAKDTDLRKKKSEEISESRRALASYVEGLERQLDKLNDISEKEKALRLLRANPSIDTPQTRELLELIASRVDKLNEEEQVRKHLIELGKQQAAVEREIRDAKERGAVEELRGFEENNKRLRELTGQAEEDRKRRDVAILEAALERGEVTQEQALIAVKAIAGITDELKKADDAAEEFGLVIASAIGDFAKDPSPKKFFESIAQDILSLTTKLLIMEPIAKRIKELLTGTGSSAGGFDFAGLFGSLFAGSFASGGFIAPGKFGIAGEGGQPEIVSGGRSGATVTPMRAGPNIYISMPQGSTPATAKQAGAAIARVLAITSRRLN